MSGKVLLFAIHHVSHSHSQFSNFGGLQNDAELAANCINGVPLICLCMHNT